MKNIVIASIAVFLVGCVTVLPTAHLRPGMSIEDVKSQFKNQYGGQESPDGEFAIMSPADPSEQLIVIEYVTANPDADGSNFAEGIKLVPHWVLFDADKQLASYGKGGISEAELVASVLYLDSLVKSKQLTFGEGEKKKYERAIEIYGTNISDTLPQYYSYSAIIGEEVDNGTKTESEAKFLISQKAADLSRLSRYETQSKSLSNRSQSIQLMTIGAGLMQMSQPRPLPGINCTSVTQGAFTNTQCR